MHMPNVPPSISSLLLLQASCLPPSLHIHGPSSAHVQTTSVWPLQLYLQKHIQRALPSLWWTRSWRCPCRKLSISASQRPPALSSVCSSASLNQTASHPCFSCFALPRHTFHTLLRSVWTVERRHFKASTTFISTRSHSHKHATFLLSFPGKISTTIYCPPPAPNSHCRWNCACNLFLTQCIYYIIINGGLLFYLFIIIIVK